jgi:hypothetical protein
VQLVGLLLRLPRTIARILDVERRRHHEHVAKTALLGAGEDHAPDARVDGEARQALAQRRQLASPIDGAQLLQHPIALGDGPRVRRIEEGEVLDLAQAERLHPQDHAREAGALDLRIGERRTRGEARLVVEAHADAVADAAAPPLSLVGARPRDPLDLQARGARARVVAREPRHAGVDHVDDPWNRQRGLGHVGGEDDAPLRDAGEDLRLLAGGEARVERLHHGVAQAPGRQLLLGLADLALARQKHQDVAARVERRHVLDRGGNRLGQIEIVGRGLVEHVHREGAALDLEDGRAAEELGEAAGLEGGRAHDDLQVRPLRQDALQPAEQKVDGQAPLVGLVHDDGVVPGEEPVAVELGEQDPVGHELHVRARGRLVLEADLVADLGAEGRPDLAGDARGHAGGGNAAGLRDADHLVDSAAHGQRDLRELGGLSRAGRPGDDHDLVLVDRRRDVPQPRRDRQLGREP